MENIRGSVLMVVAMAAFAMEDMFVKSASTHLAVATLGKYLLNVCDLSGYVAPRIAPDGPERDGACLRPSERPGLGVTPDESVLGAPIFSLREEQAA